MFVNVCLSLTAYVHKRCAVDTSDCLIYLLFGILTTVGYFFLNTMLITLSMRLQRSLRMTSESFLV